jgi:opacity protein-like surface antigen
MKKLIMTMTVAILTTFAASAQFMVVTTVNTPDSDLNEEWGTTNFTDNMGIGYMVNDKCIAGIVRAGEDAEGEASYDLWGRYLWNENLFVSVQAPTEEMMDNLTVGLGYSFDVWKGLHVEPNYSMGLKEDEVNGEREGTFSLGLSYKF